MFIAPLIDNQKMKKETKNKLKELLKMRKAQRGLYMELIKPIDDNIRILEDTIKHKVSIERFIEHSEKINKYYGEVFKKYKGGGKDG